MNSTRTPNRRLCRFGIIFLLALCVVVSAGSRECYSEDKASDQLMKKINDAGMIAKFPDAAGIIIDYIVDVNVNADYSFKERVYKLTKILNPRDRGLQETYIYYGGDWDKVHVESAKTIKRDGTVIDVKENTIIHKDQLHPIYKTNQRVCNVIYPALEQGAATELRYTIDTKMDKTSFFIQEVFMESYPVINFRFTVRVPDSIPFTKTKIEKLPEVKMSQTTSGNKRVYTFTGNSIPAFKIEPNSYLADQIRRIVLNSIKSWDEVYKWVKGYSDPIIDTGTEMKALAERITKGGRTEEEKIAAIYYYVSRQIRYVALEMGTGAWVPRAPKSVCKNEYGDCKDSATLAVSLLRSIGIKAYQVLVRAKTSPWTGDVIRDMPSRTQFNHMIACVPKKKGTGYHWLDCTYRVGLFGQVPPGNQGTDGFIIGENAHKFIKIDKSTARENKSTKSVTVEIQEDGTSRVKVQNEWTGIFRMKARAEAFGIKKVTRDNMEKLIRSQLKDPDLRLISYYLSDPADFSKKSGVEFKLEYDSGKTVSKIQNLLIYNIRDYMSQFATVFTEEESKMPLMLSGYDIPYTQHETFRVIAPKGYTLSKDDTPKHVNVDVGDMKYTQTVRTKSNEAVVDINMVATESHVSPENYKILRQALKDHLGEKKIVFSKAGAGPAPTTAPPREDVAARNLYNRAKMMEANNAYDKAIKLYQQLIDEYPGSKLVETAKKNVKKLQGGAG